MKNSSPNSNFTLGLQNENFESQIQLHFRVANFKKIESQSKLRVELKNKNFESQIQLHLRVGKYKIRIPNPTSL